MARVSAGVIAVWVIDAGWAASDRPRATAVGLATGADPAKPGGVWGTGGETDNGPSQATAALGAFKVKGWDAFPVTQASPGAVTMYLPVATAAVLAAKAVVASDSIPGGGIISGTAGGLGSAPGSSAWTDPLAALRWLQMPGSWDRITKVAVGILLAGIAGFLVAKASVLDPGMRMLRNADDAIAQQAQLANIRL